MSSYGFVDFDQPMTATIAIEELNGKIFHGRRVELKPGYTKREYDIMENDRRWAEGQLERERRAATEASGVDNDGGTGEEKEEEEQEESGVDEATVGLGQEVTLAEELVEEVTVVG